MILPFFKQWGKIEQLSVTGFEMLHSHNQTLYNVITWLFDPIQQIPSPEKAPEKRKSEIKQQPKLTASADVPISKSQSLVGTWIASEGSLMMSLSREDAKKSFRVQLLAMVGSKLNTLVKDLMHSAKMKAMEFGGGSGNPSLVDSQTGNPTNSLVLDDEDTSDFDRFIDKIEKAKNLVFFDQGLSLWEFIFTCSRKTI